MNTRQHDLAGRCVLVTGANRGLGLATARELVGRGARVIAAVREPATMPDCGVGRVLPLSVDDAGSCERLADAVGVEVDGLVNNAGIYPDDEASVLEMEETTLRHALEVNALGAYRLCRLLLPAMLRRGFGRVVNVSSGYARLDALADGAPPAYGLSKLLLNGITRALAGAVRGDVKINAVDPGWLRTDMGGPAAPRPPAEAAAEVADLLAIGADGPNGRWFHRGAEVAW